jgi:hypothetical protein
VLLGIYDLCAIHAGVIIFRGAVVDVYLAMTMRDAAVIGENITQKLKSIRRDISDVRSSSTLWFFRFEKVDMIRE